MRIWWIWVLMELGVAVQAAGFTFVPLMSHSPKLTTNVPGHQLEEIGFVPAEPGERGRASEPSWGCVLRYWNSQGGAVGFMDLPGTSSWTLGSPWKGISPPGQPRAVSCSLGSTFWTGFPSPSHLFRDQVWAELVGKGWSCPQKIFIILTWSKEGRGWRGENKLWAFWGCNGMVFRFFPTQTTPGFHFPPVLGSLGWGRGVPFWYHGTNTKRSCWATPELWKIDEFVLFVLGTGLSLAQQRSPNAARFSSSPLSHLGHLGP